MTESQRISVILADDQTIIRESLATVLELQDDFEVLAAVPDGAQAVAAVEEQAPDVVLMDLNMPVLGGVEATARITSEHPEVAVVVLTTFADDETVLAALGAGARGYLTKDAGRGDIVRAIRTAAAGQAVLDPGVQERLVQTAMAGRTRQVPEPSAADVTGEPPIDLTPREVEVLTLIGRGLSNRAIAQELFIGESTVKTHINNLFAKAHLTDRVDAARYAYARGFVTPQ